MLIHRVRNFSWREAHFSFTTIFNGVTEGGGVIVHTTFHLLQSRYQVGRLALVLGRLGCLRISRDVWKSFSNIHDPVIKCFLSWIRCVLGKPILLRDRHGVYKDINCKNCRYYNQMNPVNWCNSMKTWVYEWFSSSERLLEPWKSCSFFCDKYPRSIFHGAEKLRTRCIPYK